MTETYIIGEPCSMRTWITENGRQLFVGEPLCSGCDQPVADGPCFCMIPSPLPIIKNSGGDEWGLTIFFGGLIVQFAFLNWIGNF